MFLAFVGYLGYKQAALNIRSVSTNFDWDGFLRDQKSWAVMIFYTSFLQDLYGTNE